VSRSEDTAWESGWSDHQAQQLRRLASLTLADKLEWLEDAQRLVRHLSAAPPGSAGMKELARPANAGPDEVT
jgi:hypothetical protein